MEAIRILGRRDRLQDLALIDMIRQRQLHQDAVNPLIVVQFIDQGQQLCFGCLGRQFVLVGKNPGFFTGLFLHRHINAAGRIVANQDNGQTRRDALAFQSFDICCYFLTDFGGNELAINDLVHVQNLLWNELRLYASGVCL